jgi:exonuclease VII large subunit
MISILLQDAMLIRKIRPHPEDAIPKTDVQIVDEVLKEQIASSTSMFLTRLCVESSTRKNSVLAGRIRDLENKLADQEQRSVKAAERYRNEMEARMQAQEQKFEELRRKQDEELAAVKKAQEEKALENEKRQQETEAMLNYLIRTSQGSSQGN